MSDLIGDTSQLHSTRIPFNAIHTVVGHEQHGSFLLSEAVGFIHVIDSRATVKIVSSSLLCQVLGAPSADTAVSAYIAIIPASFQPTPSSSDHILTIGGSAFCQHSLYVPPTLVPLAFSQDVAHQLKPVPLLGSPPRVAYAVQVVGGTTQSRSTIRISGVIEVDGVGFVQSW